MVLDPYESDPFHAGIWHQSIIDKEHTFYEHLLKVCHKSRDRDLLTCTKK